MKTNWITLILIIYILTFTEAQKEKPIDESPPLDETDDSQLKTNDASLDMNENSMKESQSPEAPQGNKKEKDKPQIIAEPTGKSETESAENREINKSEGQTPERGEQSKLPMNCISDYVKFCKNKFTGYYFNDGCHNCNCTKSKKDYCEKGECRYYVASFDEAADYCTKIEKENKISFLKQISNRQKNPKIHKTNIVKPINVRISKSSNANPMQNNNKKIIKKKIIKTIAHKKKTIVINSKIEKSKNENSLDKLSIKKLPATKLKKVIISRSPLETNIEQEPMTTSKNSSVSNSNSANNYDSSLEKLIENSIENKNEKSNEKSNSQLNKDEQSAENEVKKLKKKFNTLFKNPSESKNVTSSPKSIDHIPKTKDKVVNNPIKMSLSKLSGSNNIMKALIYRIAWNDLTIERIIKSINKIKLKQVVKKKILNHLKLIKDKNSQYKMEILKIVKREMIRNKNNYSNSAIRKKDMIIFKRTLKKLVQINKALREIKEKDLTKLGKKRSHKGNENLKISFVMILLSVGFVLTCHNY